MQELTQRIMEELAKLENNSLAQAMLLDIGHMALMHDKEPTRHDVQELARKNQELTDALNRALGVKA